MAWIFSLWVQCHTHEEARAVATHFQPLRWTLSDGTQSECEVSCMADHCCIVPSNVSRSGVRNAADAAQLTEVGMRLHEHLRSAPPFSAALVGVEVDDPRMEPELVQIARDPHPAYRGLVISTNIWERAGRPSRFEPFKAGYVWWPYLGEQVAQEPAP